MRDSGLAALEMAEIAASSDPLPRRGEQALAVLRSMVPFDSAWLALVDPRHPDYTTLADADLAESTRTFLAGPTHAGELELAGTTCTKPPQRRRLGRLIPPVDRVVDALHSLAAAAQLVQRAGAGVVVPAGPGSWARDRVASR